MQRGRYWDVRVVIGVVAETREEARSVACRAVGALKQANNRILHSHVDERREGLLAWLRRRFVKDKFRGRSLIMLALALAVLSGCYGPVCGGKYVRGYPGDGALARVLESHATADGTQENWYIVAEEMLAPYRRWAMTVDAPVRPGERIVARYAGEYRWRVERLDFRRKA